MPIPDLEQETKHVKEAMAEDLSAGGIKQLLAKKEMQAVIPELPQDVSKLSGSCHWSFLISLWLHVLGEL